MAATKTSQQKTGLKLLYNPWIVNKPKLGATPYYKTPEQLEKTFDEYFNFCLNNDYPLTITGLTLYAGFCDRQALDSYSEKNEVFSLIIKRAKSVVEHKYELGLHNTSTVTGSIFALKQFKWIDNQKIDIGLENLVKAPELNEDQINSIADKVLAKL